MAEYDISKESGKVRLLISDIGGADGKSFLFEDNEIDAFLELGGSIKYAAATALRSIAGNEAQVSKRIRYLELQTDGPAVTKALTDLADKFQKEAEEGDDDAAADIAGMSWEGC